MRKDLIKNTFLLHFMCKNGLFLIICESTFNCINLQSVLRDIILHKKVTIL